MGANRVIDTYGWHDWISEKHQRFLDYLETCPTDVQNSFKPTYQILQEQEAQKEWF